MKRTFIVAQSLFMVVAFTPAFAFADAQISKSSSIQEITITNTLWNEHATGGAAGLTKTSIIAAFNNGGNTPCFTTTLAFDGSTTIQVGIGQPCVAAVTSIAITPVAGPAGTVYAAPANVTIDGSNFATQIVVADGTDPVFDTTNGAVKTQGVILVTSQGFASSHK